MNHCGKIKIVSVAYVCASSSVTYCDRYEALDLVNAHKCKWLDCSGGDFRVCTNLAARAEAGER
jgi:hypothetical protein